MGPFSHSFSVSTDTIGLTDEKQITVYFSKFINFGTINKHRYVNYMSSNDKIFYLRLPICKKIMNCKSFFPLHTQLNSLALTSNALINLIRLMLVLINETN